MAPGRVEIRLVSLPGGQFLMGAEDEDGFPGDAESPVRTAEVAPFAISATTVTNRAFALFVAETGYRTDAEEAGWSFVFHSLLDPAAGSDVIDAHLPNAPWWLPVEGAFWAVPEGAGSDVADREEHPVVQVSFRDAQEFCAWGGYRLPREAEWEFAARGGLEQARYPWGDELNPGGTHMCNIWQGDFPDQNTLEDGYAGTCPAEAFPPNGYGLYNVAGNVWELCDSSWAGPDGSPSADEVVLRGGSYLCHASYCNRYRVAARTKTTLASSSGNTGFRVVSAR